MCIKLASKFIKPLVFLLSIFSLGVVAEQCEKNAKILQANYLIEEITHSDKEHQAKSKNNELTLIRNKEQVAYVYPSSNITNIWIKYPNNQVALNRYFEEQKRSIEYQPSELKRVVNWENLYQLISTEQIKEMTLKTTEGQGCYKQQEYHLVKGESNVELTWLPELRVVKKLKVSNKHQSKIWQLKELDLEVTTVNTYFNKHYNYQSTDYADIGDMESDPFLVKMINLGFIEHTPQGFYNSDGDNISPAHHRH